MSTKSLVPLIAALVLGIASTAHATDIPANSWAGPWDTIERVYPMDAGFAIVLSQHTYPGHTDACYDGRQFWVAEDDPNYEEKARTLLAAFLAGRQVLLYWDTSDTCRAHINRFQVR